MKAGPKDQIKAAPLDFSGLPEGRAERRLASSGGSDATDLDNIGDTGGMTGRSMASFSRLVYTVGNAGRSSPSGSSMPVWLRPAVRVIAGRICQTDKPASANSNVYTGDSSTKSSRNSYAYSAPAR